MAEIVSRAAVGPFSGQGVIGVVLVFYSAWLALGIYSQRASHSRENRPAG